MASNSPKHRNNKHRVLFRYSSHQYDTGSPKSLIAMIDLLKESDFEPVYFATGKGPLITELDKRNIEIIHGDVQELSLKSPIAFLKRIHHFRKVLRKLNISLLHMNEFGWSQDIVLAAWTMNIPVVLHCHNPSAILFSNLNRFAASKVLTVSSNHLNDMEGISLVKEKCDVLYNTIDIDKYSKGKDLRKSLGFEDNDILVGSIAQISHRKGTDIAIETAKLLVSKNPNLNFLFVGPPAKGEKEYVDSVKQTVDECGLKSNVHFLGSRSDIPDILNTLDIFFLPTRAEPFGMVITEALAAGLPVVASRVGGIPEIIYSDDLGYLVHPLKPNLFAEKLLLILKAEDHGLSLGSNGKKSLSGRFDQPSIREKLVGIYKSLIKTD